MASQQVDILTKILDFLQTNFKNTGNAGPQQPSSDSTGNGNQGGGSHSLEYNQIMRDFKDSMAEYKRAMEELETFKSDSFNQQIDKAKSRLEETTKQLDKIRDQLDELDKKKNQLNKGEYDDALLRLRRQETELIRQQEANRETLRNARMARVDNWVKLYDTIKKTVLEVRSMAEPWGKIDQAAANYAKSVGVSVAGMKAMRDETLRAAREGRFGIKYNISADELIKLQEGISNTIGRNVTFSSEGQENLAAMNAVMKENATEMFVQLENFGLSLNDAADRSGKMFSKASQYGISFEKYSRNFLENIRIAQNYTFKDGLRGLDNMARKASAIKLDMQQVAQFASRVQSVEGALDAAARLQVLGGSFAALANPLAMMNEGLNDMEGLQDRVASMIQGLGRFNRQTGEVEVSSYNKRRVQAAAEAMGMDYSQLMQSVNATARRGEIDRQITAFGKAGLSDEMKELIRNVGTIQDGKAGVSIGGKFIGVEELTNEHLKVLRDQTKSESDDIKDIATILRGWNDVMEGAKKQKDIAQASLTRGLGEGIKDLTSTLGMSNKLLTTLLVVEGIRGAVGIVRGFTDIGRGFFGGRGGVDRRLTSPNSNGGGGGVRRRRSPGGGGSGGGSGTRGVGRSPLSRLNTRVNYAARTASNAINRTGVGRRLAGSALGRTSASIGRTVAKTAGRGFGLGLVTAGASIGIDALRDSQIRKGNIEKGSGWDTAASISSATLQGAGLGMAVAPFLGVFGPVAIAAGTAIGGIVGAVNASKRKAEAQLDKALGSVGIESIQGKYRKREMKDITTALATGKLDDETRGKLLANGDKAILDEIDKRRAKEAKITPRAQMPQSTLSRINSANIHILSANLDPREIIKPKLLKGTGSEAVRERTTYRNREARASVEDTVNLNINGTIRLEGANGRSVDITDDIMNSLLRNKAFVSKITNMVNKEIDYSKFKQPVKRGIGDTYYRS